MDKKWFKILIAGAIVSIVLSIASCIISVAMCNNMFTQIKGVSSYASSKFDTIEREIDSVTYRMDTLDFILTGSR